MTPSSTSAPPISAGMPGVSAKARHTQRGPSALLGGSKAQSSITYLGSRPVKYGWDDSASLVWKGRRRGRISGQLEFVLQVG
jgi:hypothetical protein